MKREKEKEVFKWSKSRPIFLLVLILTAIQFLFVEILILGHNSVLPVREEDLTVLLSVGSGLVASAVGATVVIYISHIQQKAQNQFFIEHEANERKRLFLQFYIQQMESFVDRHQKWISSSDFFIKNYEKLEISDVKWNFREIWDNMVVLYRFKDIFLDEVVEEEWKNLKNQMEFLKKWLDEQCIALKKGEKREALAEEYFSLFYKEISGKLNIISDLLMEIQKNRIMELKEEKA